MAVKSVSEGTDSRTKALLGYFIRALGGNLGRTKLIKLAYLTDLFARMTLGKPVTSYRYALYENGPFDPGFYGTVSALEAEGSLKESFHKELNGYRYEWTGTANDTGELSREEKFIAGRVLEEYGHVPLDILLDEVVYRSEPARKAKEAGAVGLPLDMDACNNRIKDQLGCDLGAFLDSKEASKRGERITLDDAIRSL